MATLPGADIRGYYTALGIQLPAWATVEAPASCFADPDAHQHQDRNPSCSVNLQTGAFNCHGCGAHGGAYDAALAKGHSPRSAIDLMITHGLTQPRTPHHTPRAAKRRRPATAPPAATTPAATWHLIVTDRDITNWQQQLARQPHPLPHLRPEQQALWDPEIMSELELGLHRGRITIPIRDHDGHLQGVLRYAPHHAHTSKMLAVPGTRLGLIPHPNSEPSRWIVLVEGPPDMIAARSQQLPAIAIPGDHAWNPQWAPLFTGRHIAIVTDADRPGRHAASRIAHHLAVHATSVRIIDPAPQRSDAYDLTDWLHAHPTATGPEALRQLATVRPQRSHRPPLTAQAAAVTPDGSAPLLPGHTVPPAPGRAHQARAASR
jgi:Toprim-like